MTKFLLTIYSIGVLMFSGFARGEEVGIPGFALQPIQVRSVEFSPSQFLVRIEGIKPNPCYSTPVPVLAPSEVNPLAWSLKLVARPSNNICAQVKSPFALVFDVRTLFYGKQLSLQPNDLLVIKIDATRELIELSGDQVQTGFPFANAVHRGVIELIGEDHLVLTNKGQVVAELSSPLFDVSQFLGRKVEVTGLTFENELPILNPTENLPQAGIPHADSKVLVTGISTSGI